MPVTFDYDHGVVCRGDVSVHLSPSEADLFKTIADAGGKPVPMSRLIVALYGLGESPDLPNRVIMVHLHHIRRKLTQVGVCIRNNQCRGYFIEEGITQA